MRSTHIQQRPPGKGLVFAMSLMDYVSGVTAALLFDESENGFAGTAVNAPVPKRPGFDFTAASSMYIDIGTGPTITKTISLWVKQDDVAGNEYPIDLNGTDYLSIESGKVTVNGLVGHTLYVNGIVGTSGVATITAGKWHHIAITDSTENDASDLDIGRADIGPAVYFDGLIADVRLYSRLLASDEILSIYYLQRHKFAA